MSRRPSPGRRGPGPVRVAVLLGAGLLTACSASGSASTALPAGGGPQASTPAGTTSTTVPGFTAPGAAPGATSGAAGGTTGASDPTSVGASPRGAGTSSSTVGATPSRTAPPSSSPPTGGPDPSEGATAGAGDVAARTMAPVPVQAEERFSEGLAVRVVGVREQQVTARYPGEVSGPGMVVELAFRNGSAAPVDLDGIRVAATHPDGTPASGLDGPPAVAPTGVLAPGDEGRGTFVYSVPQGSSRSMTLEISSISSTDVVTVDV
ncbi:hypothetical protein ACFEMC_07925 [Kineococcus sp. DHX-1]|uniref:hypothetical protein n=1 Tax=Kineococcus sp. DHX-1 TaxID=3349638 RepID=UPI0036D332CC